MTTIRNFRTIMIGVCFLQFTLLQMFIPRLLQACPTCKDGLHDDGTAAAYAFSILFMMGMPFVILSCWVTTIMRLRTKMNDAPQNDLDW